MARRGRTSLTEVIHKLLRSNAFLLGGACMLSVLMINDSGTAMFASMESFLYVLVDLLVRTAISFAVLKVAVSLGYRIADRYAQQGEDRST